MAHGFVMDVPMPIEMYDAVHAEVQRRTDGPVEGRLLHPRRPRRRLTDHSALVLGEIGDLIA